MTSVSPRLDQVSERLAQGQTSAVQLAEQALERATQGEGPRVFTRVLPEQALAEARASDALRAAGLARSPLEGLPISVKDLFDIAGHPRWAAPGCWPMPHPPRRRPKSCSACAARARSSWARPI